MPSVKKIDIPTFEQPKARKATVDNNKTKSKISSDNIDIDVVKFMIKYGLSNVSDDPEFVEFVNIDSDKIPYSEVTLIHGKGAVISNLKAVIRMKETDLTNALPLTYPDRQKPVLTLQDVTKFRFVTDGEGQTIYDTVQQTRTQVKTGPDGLPYMTNGSEERYWRDLTQEEIASGQWSIVYEQVTENVQVPRQESYTEQELLPDPNGTMEDKTWLDVGYIIYEDKGKNKDVLVIISDKLNSTNLTDIDGDNKYTVMLKKDAISLITEWTPSV